MASERLRSHRGRAGRDAEEAADAECEERPEATEAVPQATYHMRGRVVRDQARSALRDPIDPSEDDAAGLRLDGAVSAVTWAVETAEPVQGEEP